ncbi:uncharacterized protein LOC117647827 [Thrips palmi]|uniref:Uncharacterized protein LOC117647827 n=1 Tax=Thrips palmi TaxID=161013 RepID=A0A6P8ZQE0_THRPL|nr:uncharacterized protein LOC117647827 [Thrips palmi]
MAAADDENQKLGGTTFRNSAKLSEQKDYDNTSWDLDWDPMDPYGSFMDQKMLLLMLNILSASVTTGFGHGEIELVVQHRANELAVWRKDHPADVVTAAVDPTESASLPSTLRIRPHTWELDMPVQFSDATVA